MTFEIAPCGCEIMWEEDLELWMSITQCDSCRQLEEEELDDCSICEGCYNCTGEVEQE